MPTDTAAQDFTSWLLAQARPGGSDPLSRLAAHLCRRGGRRLPSTPAALAVLLRRTGASPAVHAAAVVAVRQWTEAVRADLLAQADEDAHDGHREALAAA
ncbi:hypothetical protein SAMN05660350_01092 [Geodermatophilus obscurus]|uniref:Uncharacterized protein n=1 Tax=Geodermatophilus obscurus TaxID=1861 RepID=A0A1M7SWQ5_9ACTN|nr:hypothetical protein [Geodermatophilus obscurus]SHN62804.1 hypothetical protein SAMN05660350_01092 [Geodermatophilus obscurus]